MKGPPPYSIKRQGSSCLFYEGAVKGEGLDGLLTAGLRCTCTWPHLVWRYGLWIVEITELSFLPWSPKNSLALCFPFSTQNFDRVRKQAIKGCKIPQQLHIKTQTHAKPTKEMLLLFSHTDVGTPWEAERPHGSENVDLWDMKRWRKWKGTQENKSSWKWLLP